MDILKDMKVFDIDLYSLRSPDFHEEMLQDRDRLLEQFGECLLDESAFVCPLCGGKDKHLLFSYKHYHLYRCEKCTSVAPSLDHGRLDELGFYQTDIVIEDVQREIIATFDYRKRTFGQERISYLKELIPGFASTSDEKVLDVGCGPGYFLSALADAGIAGRGLEVNPACINHCQSLGLDVADGQLEDEPEGEYSLITMFDVIEHVSDPVDFLSQCCTALRPGGHLLAYTPNIESMSIHLMGGQHNMVAPFLHLCFFNPQSLDYLADKAGLRIEKIEYFGLDIIDYLGMREADTGHPHFEELRPMTGPVQAVLDSSGLSNCMRILFQKV